MMKRNRTPKRGGWQATKPSAVYTLLFISSCVVGCTNATPLSSDEFEQWQAQARAQVVSGAMAWSDFYQRSFDQLSALPSSLNQDAQLANTIMLLSSARKFEAHEMTAQEFAIHRESLEIQLRSRLR